MAEHLHEWLNAYLDGELSAWRRERVKKHLAECPACRAELDALRHLSQVIQQVPLPQELPSAERFTAQLMLRLPRRPNQPARRPTGDAGWWLAPAGLLLLWAFIQAVFWLSTGLSTAGLTGLLGQQAVWLAPASQEAGIFTSALHWLGVMPGGSLQQIVGFSESFGWGLLTQLLIQGGLALLCLGWLVVWWHRNQQVHTGMTQLINQNDNQ